MEFDWSTFLLEIINFLVLLWILKRFLYKPILDVIARRRAGIEDRLAEARRAHDEADALKAEYENRLEDWDKERRKTREKLAHELEAERTKQMQTLRETISNEREKARVAEARQRAEATRETERQALEQAAEFAARLMGDAAGPELESRLLDRLLADMSKLSSEEINSLRTQWGDPPESVMVASAFSLAEDRRQRIETALQEVTGVSVPVHYTEDPDLLAGLRITVGAWVLQANVRDELKAFAGFAHGTG